MLRRVVGLVITTDYVYDSLGRMIQQIAKPNLSDPNSWLTTKYHHDSRGSRIKMTKPDGSITTYAYNDLGQKTEMIADVGGIEQKTEYGYDRLGRQTSITGYADGSTAQKCGCRFLLHV